MKRSSRATASWNSNSTIPKSTRRPDAKAGAIGKERGALAKSVEPYIEYKRLCAAIADAEAMAADPDMKAMADEELAELRPKRDALHAKIEERLLVDPGPKTTRGADRRNSRRDRRRRGRAVRGQPARNVPQATPATKGWKIEEISSSPGEAGGFKEISFGVSGEDAYQFLRYESGGHRVQRVPATETQGRIHTSAATVAVMPEPEEAQVYH